MFPTFHRIYRSLSEAHEKRHTAATNHGI